RMATARAARLQPLQVSEVPVNNAALIIGGGAAGMTAALALADQGFPVHLIEREAQLGGNLRQLQFWVPDGRPRGTAQSPAEYLAAMRARVLQHERIHVHLGTEHVRTGGFKGNFTSTVAQNGEQRDIQHGATIVATGGVEYKGPEYGYGTDPRIVTQLEFEQLLAKGQTGRSAGRSISKFRSVVMIQCVGPAEKFCSRICCTTALKNALKLKEINRDADITVLYRDIRTFGFKERVYTEARRMGVRFVHFDFDRKPEVQIGETDFNLSSPISDNPLPITVKIYDPTVGMELELQPDLLVLSTPVVPSPGTQELATRLKVPVDMDGFFLEAHVKLRPVDFAADGVFMAGLAHYPKFLDETIAQAQAAAARAAGILSQEKIVTSARVAVVDQSKCTGCLTCVRVCPYNVPVISNDYVGVGNLGGAAYIEPAICHGCGTCVAECPAKAIQLLHYTDAQMLTKVDALFGSALAEPDLIPMESIRVVG
ncbi:MAG: CoB--CoM heterodisulfide reductase iron-sulfur subunit A family protein, partial [Anaerolineales bacterium]